MITVNVSVGELLDKISILQIKSEKIDDIDKLANIHNELNHLTTVACDHRLPELEAQLRKVNEALWDIEDRIRVKEKMSEFDDEFIELARLVYITNDKRADIKREINLVSNSDLIEEKFYSTG